MAIPANFVVVMVTPIGLASIRGNYFWIWTIVCASFVPLTYFFAVETSGRTLEQVDQMVRPLGRSPMVLLGPRLMRNAF